MSERGMTVIELLVASVLLLLALAMGTAFHSFAMAGWNGETRRAELGQYVRIAAEELVEELNFAGAVWVDSGKQEILYSKKKDGKEQAYRFYLLGSQLMLRLPGGSSVPIASGIEQFVQGPDGEVPPGGAVVLSIRASGGDGGAVELRSCVRPRNIR